MFEVKKDKQESQMHEFCNFSRKGFELAFRVWLLTFVLLVGYSKAETNEFPLPAGIQNAQNETEDASVEDRLSSIDYRKYPAIFERVVPRFLSRNSNTNELVLKWSYAVVARQDLEVFKMLDPDCPKYNIPAFIEVLEGKEFDDIRTWDKNWPLDRKINHLKPFSEQLGSDGTCLKTSWSLPLSSLAATRDVARSLKRAWERFEDRYFFRVVTELNNPIYWFAYCTLGLGIDSYSYDNGTPPDKDFIPDGTLPPELGALFTDEVYNIISQYRIAITNSSPERLSSPNYDAASRGQHREPLYVPFFPTKNPREFCDNLGFNLPVFHIPAISVKVCGFTVLTTPGYPDSPWIFDYDEADRRIKRAVAHSYENYYPDYLVEVFARLVPFGQLIPTRSSSGQLGTLLNQISNLNLGNLQNSSNPIDLAKQTFSALEGGIAYFPLPWQAPMLGGGAVITPVFDYIYPDPLRSAQDIMTIYDMVGALLGGESLSGIEKAALALYYLQPLFAYMNQPILPGIIDQTYAESVVGNAFNSLYSIIYQFTAESVNKFVDTLQDAGTRAFGPDAGLAFAVGARLILSPFRDILNSITPQMFVENTIYLFRELDRYLINFAQDQNKEKSYSLLNVRNGAVLSPGLWRFEELKRVFPVSSPLTQALFGYGSFFASWSELNFAFLPDPMATWNNAGEYMWALLSRIIGFWHVPLTINICFGSPPVTVGIEIPRYMPVSPYLLPFFGEQYHWGWFNVPEAYPMSLVKGIPGAPLPSLGTSATNFPKVKDAYDSYNSAYGQASLVDIYEKFLFGLNFP